MKNNLTSLLTTTYDMMRYIHKYQYFATLRPLREGLFTVASNQKKLLWTEIKNILYTKMTLFTSFRCVL